MASEFTTNKNKGFLWDFLYKNGMFKNLTNIHEHRVKTIFEKEILSIKNSATTENITELNKAFITKIIAEIGSLKVHTNSPQRPIIENNNKQDHDLKTPMNYTRQEAALERQKLFQENLQETQNNFHKHMKVVKPKAIDFSDDVVDDGDTNLDSKLAEIVERRKRDMHMVVSSYDTPPEKPSDNISIGKETTLDKVQIVDIEPKKIKKSVSFDENSITSAIGKNIEDLFNHQVDKKANTELDTLIEPKEEAYNNKNNHQILDENIELTVDKFLSRLKTKSIAYNEESVTASTPESSDDKDKFQTILHEIADIHDTLRIILETIKKD